MRSMTVCYRAVSDQHGRARGQGRLPIPPMPLVLLMLVLLSMSACSKDKGDRVGANAYNDLGNALMAKGDLAGAIVAYNKAIELNPKASKAYYNLGIALKAKGDLAGAIVAYNKAIELNPKFSTAYCNLAVAYYVKKDYGSAWKVIRAARRKGLGKGIHPKFLQDLEKESGRKE